MDLLELDEEIRPRKVTKLDKMDSSSKYHRKRQQTEIGNSNSVKQLIVKEIEQRGSLPNNILTIQMQPNYNESSFLQRVGKRTSGQQSINLFSQDSVEQKQKEFLRLDDEAEINKQSIFVSPPIKSKSRINSDEIILVGATPILNLFTYLKSVHNTLYDSKQQADSYEVLIQRAQIADNFLNQFGMLYVLKTVLQKKKITAIFKDFIDIELEDEDQSQQKGKPIIVKSTKSKSKTNFNDLIYIGSSYSQFTFEIIFNDIHNSIYESFTKFYSNRLKFLELVQKQIEKILCHQEQKKEIIFQSITKIQDSFSLKLSMPSFKDTLQNNFSKEFLKYINNFNNYQILSFQWIPLLSFIDFSLEDLDPYRDHDFTNKTIELDCPLDQPYGWKLFALKHDYNPNRNFGYINIFPCSDNIRQDLKWLNRSTVEEEGIIVFKKIFSNLEKYPFFISQTINVKMYGQQRSYHMLGKVSFSQYESVRTSDEILNTNMVFLTDLADIQLVGILIKELI